MTKSKARPCPRCRKVETRRSQRAGFIETVIFRWLWIKPYRCEHCDKRFYRWP